jgi:hypothetical protein
MATLSLVWLVIIIIITLIYIVITTYPHVTLKFWIILIGIIIIIWLFFRTKLGDDIRALWLVTVVALIATVGLVAWAIKGRVITFNSIISSYGLIILYWIAVVAMVIFALFNLVNNFWLGVFALIVAFILFVLPIWLLKGDMVSEKDYTFDIQAFANRIIVRDVQSSVDKYTQPLARM